MTTRTTYHLGDVILDNNTAVKNLTTFLGIQTVLKREGHVRRQHSPATSAAGLREAVAFTGNFSSIIPARPGALKLADNAEDGTNITCPTKTSKASAKAALSSRLLGVSL